MFEEKLETWETWWEPSKTKMDKPWAWDVSVGVYEHFGEDEVTWKKFKQKSRGVLI